MHRMHAATGIAFVVLSLAAFATGGNSPNAYASGDVARDWFVANRDAALRSAYLLALASGLFVWFVGTLTARLGEEEGGDRVRSRIAFGGGVLAAGSTFAMGALFAGLAFGASPDLDAATAAALVAVQRGFVPVTHVAMAIFILASSLVVFRSTLLPRWLAWLGVGVAAFKVMGASSMMFEGMVFGMDGAVESFGVLAGLVWVAASSGILAIRARAAAAPASAPLPPSL